MGPTWGPSGADRTKVGPMFAPWTLLSGIAYPSELWVVYWDHLRIGFSISCIAQKITSVVLTTCVLLFSYPGWRLYDDAKTRKSFPHYGPFCDGNPLVTGGFPSHRSSDVEIWGFFMLALTSCWTNNGVDSDLGRHVMSLWLFSWFFQVDIHNVSRSGDTSSFERSGEWQLLRMPCFYRTHAYTTGIYSELWYFVVIQRKPKYYLFNYILPSCFIQVRSKNTLIARFMGPTWGPSGADRTQVGPMLAPRTLLSGWMYLWTKM